MKKFSYKKFFLIFTFLFLTFNLFSTDNVEPENKSYYQINTKYFQIIYQPESLETATIIAENADRIYEEIAKKLGTETNLSIPVLIRSDIQALNAYFTSYPYNRIVIYDTVPDSQNLAVFSETILSVFYHELTHAVSLNMKSKPWEIASFLFGDFFSPTVLTSPTMFSEGATVSFESAFGEGRLNSGYAKNILVQAKLENNLPDWKEASGANDKYRVGDYPYIFGGAFHQFLQEKYGMEKYSELWKELGSTHLFTESAFKKVYGTKLKDEWKLFLETIPLLPVVESNQIELTKKDNITCFDVVNDTIVYYSKNEKGIFRIKNNQTQKIITELSVVDLAISEDESFLAVTKLSENYEYLTYIFDLQEKKYLSGVLKSFRLPVFSKIDDKLVLCGLISQQNKETILFYEIDANKNLSEINISNKWEYFSNLEVFDIASNEEKNRISLIGKIKNQWYFAEIKIDYLKQMQNQDLSLIFEKVYKFPENFVPYSLVANKDNSYFFSYTEKNYSLSRFATLIDDKLYTQQEDISGGIFSPYLLGNGFAFLNQKLKYNTISFVKNIPGGLSDGLVLEDISKDFNKEFYEIEKQQKENPNLKITFEKSKKYSDFNFLNKTVLIPLFSNFDITTSTYLTLKSAQSLPGFTLMYQNPLENRALGFGFGYLQSIMNGHVSFTSVGLVDSFFLLTGVFEREDNSDFSFSESDISIKISKSFPITKSNMTVGFDFNRLYYIPNNLKTVKLTALNVQMSGMYGALGAGIYIEKYKEGSLFTPSIFGTIKIPRLLPFSSPFGVTLNLPVNISWALCQDFSSLINLTGEITLFSAEIHKAVPLIPLYVNRFSITSEYLLMINNKTIESFYLSGFFDKLENLEEKTSMLQAITASAYFELTPVIGNLTNVRTKFGIDFVYYLNYPISREVPYEITIAGMFTF